MSDAHSTSANGQTIRLSDGRTLGYAEYGRPEGKPLFYFHGHPGSRFEARFLADAAAKAGVRLIGMDRPGMGLSSYDGHRRIVDWPKDVTALADQLGVERFAVVGLSGGGPYVAACACHIPDRLLACGIVSGAGRISAFVTFLSRWVPWLLLPMTRRFFQDQKRAEETLARVANRWAAPDQEILKRPEIKAILAASLVEGLAQGARGAAYDGMLLGGDWGFKLEDIQFPNVYWWHGALDKEAPIESARVVAEQIPHCEATYYPDESHMSVMVNHAQEIVATLMA